MVGTVDATVVVGIGIHLHDPVAVVASDFASFADAVVPPFAVAAEDTVDAAFELSSSFAVAAASSTAVAAFDASAPVLLAHAAFAGAVAVAEDLVAAAPSFAAPALQRSWVQHWEREILADGREVTALNP